MNKAARIWLIIGGLSLLLCTGCPKERDNSGPTRKMRPECSKPSADCWDDCFNRDATKYCLSCCEDNTILCNNRKPYDLEKCKQEL